MPLTSSVRKREFDSNAENFSSGEMWLADLFQQFLIEARPRRCIPKLSGLYREVSATVGVADFLGIVAPRWNYTGSRIKKFFNGLPSGPVAEVLIKINRKNLVSREEFFENTAFSRPVISSTLYGLTQSGAINLKKGKKAFYMSGFNLPQADLIFYELKLTKWRRALYQASQALEYCDKAYCVLPAHKKKVMKRQIDIFRNAGIGLILFDSMRWKIVELVPAKRCKPKRPLNKISVLLKLPGEKNLFY